MMNLDEYVDALENAVANQGVLSIDLKQLAPAPSLEPHQGLGIDRTEVLIEMLRVWMEHRWRAGYPVSVRDCLSEFPGETFSDKELEDLRFEEQRLRQTAAKSSIANSGSWSVDALPSLGEMWGEFELLSVLGVGAFAKVYLARQHGLAGRLVALKLTFRQTSESQWLASLQHSAIVPIYSTHRRDSVYGICMPFLGNSTLADLLEETSKTPASTQGKWWSRTGRGNTNGGGALLSTIQQRHGQIDTIVKTVDKSDSVEVVNAEPNSIPGASLSPANSATSQKLSECDYVEAVCWIASQLADALSYAHRNGLVHSDIKPANILLAFDGQPRLLDFNVSYMSSADGVVDLNLPLGGTIPYMSPEHRQAFSQSSVVDARSDIYSLGVVLFEMLTGRLPNDRDSKVSDPRDWNSAVSPAMSAIVRKCLHYEVTERYQSADALRDDLTAQLHHEPLVHQVEPSAIERLLKWCHRHPRVSSSVSIATLATIIIAFLAGGVAIRQVALNKADWVHRMDLLQSRLPNSMALVTSLHSLPELESEVVADLESTFSLIVSKDSTLTTLDPRWKLREGVSDDVRSDTLHLAWLASRVAWKKSPLVPVSLEAENGSTAIESKDWEKRTPVKLIQERKFSDAIGWLKKRIEQDPRDHDSWWLLGDCYHENQEFNNSQNAYTVCIALQPRSAIAYVNRGMARLSSGMFESAAQDYSTASRLAPTFSICRFNHALALQQLGRIDEAIGELDLAIEAGYSTVSAHRLRGDLLAAKGDVESAKLEYANALRCKPTTDQHWLDRGLILLNSNPVSAAKDFESALEVNPTSAAAHQKLAYVYSELLHSPDKGLEHSNRLVDLLPSEPMHLAGRAVLHARSGRTDEANSDLSRLEKMELKDPIVVYQVACAYSMLAGAAHSKEQDGKSASTLAFRWYTRSLNMEPGVLSIALTDPDVQWMREQPQFQEIAKAVNTLKLKPTSN